MCIVCLLGSTTILKNFFFFGEGGRQEREWEKNPFSTCTCIYYDVRLAHLCVEDFHYSKQFLLL